MKKNPGRKERRRVHQKNQAQYSEKKRAINERIQLWRRNWQLKRKIPEGFKKNEKAMKAFTQVMEG